MSFADDDRPRPPVTPKPGEALAELSLEELKQRIELYQAEIERLKAEIDAKAKHLKAADAFFRR